MDILQAISRFDWHSLNVQQLHCLRPWWLLGILPAAIVAFWIFKQPPATTRWNKVIDQALLPALLGNNTSRHKRWPIVCLFAAWVLAVIALAGPSWNKIDSLALKQADALVILLDLSPSMLVKDVAPSRLQAAQFKILDLLKQRHEGYTGLIAYSGSAHVVAPLSDDNNTIAALVPSLEPGIMPKLGSQVEDAVAAAIALLNNAHFARGRILLMTDGVIPQAVENIREQLKDKSIELHVIGVGTAVGGPIPLVKGGYVQDDQGKTQLFPFSSDTLKMLANNQHGQYNDISVNDSDINALIALPTWLADIHNGETRESGQTVEHWQDNGYWLLFPLLLLSLLGFRRGLVVGIVPLFLIAAPDTSHALDWNSLWNSPDQQAKKQLDAHDNAAAAQLFNDPQWKAYAEYQNGQHAEAAEHFASGQSAEALYNRGNALAKNNQLEESIASYEKALEQQKDFPDAIANRDLVKSILEKQKQQQKNDQKKQNDQQKKDDQKKQDDQQQDDQQNQEDQQKNNEQQKPDDQQKDNQQKQDGEQQPDNQQQEDTQQSEQKQRPDEKSAEEKAAEEKQKQDDMKKQQAEKKQSEESSADDKKPQDDSAQPAEQETPEEAEKRQATEQWLRKVPDDPGGLLRNKFEYYYQENQRQENRNRRNGSSSSEPQRW